jgi:hypothetical protein
VNGELPPFATELEMAQSICHMQTYYEWKLKNKANDTQNGNWNKLSVFKLFTGRA